MKMAKDQNLFDEYLLRLKNNDPNLTVIDLENQDLTQDEIKLIATSIKTNTMIQKLKLSRNRILDTGAITLAAAIAENNSLLCIHLHSAGIGSTGAKSIATILELKTNLEAFSLSNNPIKATGVIAIAIAFREHPKLKLLSLARCGMRDEGVQALATMLDTNSVLTTLEVSTNQISAIGMKYMAQHLNNHPSLKLLAIRENCMGYFFDEDQFNVERFYTMPVSTSVNKPKPAGSSLLSWFWGSSKQQPITVPLLTQSFEDDKPAIAVKRLHIQC